MSALTIPEVKDFYTDLRKNLNQSASKQINGFTTLERKLIKESLSTIDQTSTESPILKAFLSDAVDTHNEIEDNDLSVTDIEKFSLPQFFTKVQNNKTRPDACPIARHCADRQTDRQTNKQR